MNNGTLILGALALILLLIGLVSSKYNLRTLKIKFSILRGFELDCKFDSKQ